MDTDTVRHSTRLINTDLEAALAAVVCSPWTATVVTDFMFVPIGTCRSSWVCRWSQRTPPLLQREGRGSKRKASLALQNCATGCEPVLNKQPTQSPAVHGAFFYRYRAPDDLGRTTHPATRWPIEEDGGETDVIQYRLNTV